MSDIIAEMDTPIQRVTIDHIPVAALDEWLDKIRARRLLMAEKVEKLQGEKLAKQQLDTGGKYTREYGRVLEALRKLDEQFDLIDKRVQRLKKWEIELS